jgi:hypothetical protein
MAAPLQIPDLVTVATGLFGYFVIAELFPGQRLPASCLLHGVTRRLN